MKIGDKVETHTGRTGIITSKPPLKYQGFDWMVFVDDESVEYPYIEDELYIIDESLIL